MALTLATAYDDSTGELLLVAGGAWSPAAGLVFARYLLDTGEYEVVATGAQLVRVQAPTSGVARYVVQRRVGAVVTDQSPVSYVLSTVDREADFLRVMSARTHSPSSVPFELMVSGFLAVAESRSDFSESNFESADEQSRQPVV